MSDRPLPILSAQMALTAALAACVSESPASLAPRAALRPAGREIDRSGDLQLQARALVGHDGFVVMTKAAFFKPRYLGVIRAAEFLDRVVKH